MARPGGPGGHRVSGRLHGDPQTPQVKGAGQSWSHRHPAVCIPVSQGRFLGRAGLGANQHCGSPGRRHSRPAAGAPQHRCPLRVPSSPSQHNPVCQLCHRNPQGCTALSTSMGEAKAASSCQATPRRAALPSSCSGPCRRAEIPLLELFPQASGETRGPSVNTTATNRAGGEPAEGSSGCPSPRGRGPLPTSPQ